MKSNNFYNSKRMGTMNTTGKKNSAEVALKKAIEVRKVWMQALSGKISKSELDAAGISFMAISE